VKKIYPNGDFDEFFYHPTTRQNTSIVRHLGATTQTTTFEYDARRLLERVTYPDGRFILYTHDSLGRRETITTSDGYTDRWEYDGESRLSKVLNGAGIALVTFSYDTMGRVKSRTLANGASTAFTFTGAEQVETVTHRRPDGSIIAVFAYEYDALGHCRAVTGPDGRAEYDYDRSGRMSEARLPGGRVITYAFDPEGNRTSVRITASSRPIRPIISIAIARSAATLSPTTTMAI
jgi:YD repeat-containing protein